MLPALARVTLSAASSPLRQALQSTVFGTARLSSNLATATTEEMAPSRRGKAFVVGVGMTKFEKPGKGSHDDYPSMAKEATEKALADAGISYDQIQQAAVGYVYGDSTCGQRALYAVGMTGIPIYNVNNNCSTGSTALIMAKQLVEGGISDCVLALGFEKMKPGSLSNVFDDRANPMENFITVMNDIEGISTGPFAAQLFGNAAREHMAKYGSKPEHCAKIAYKNHLHSTRNPYSQFQDEYSLEQIQSSPTIHAPLTKFQCCPTSDGSAAVIVCSEDFVRKHNLYNTAVEILAMEMVTDTRTTFDDKSSMKLVGYDMTKEAANKVFSKAGKTRDDVQVVELHDCFSANELITYEALGLCPEGGAGDFIDAGDNTYGGKYVVNPSGGLISKGHPLGATGLAQCTELNWQLRNQADRRQVPGAKLALQHNIGLGGAVVVALYQKAFPEYSQTTSVHAAGASAGGFKSEGLFSVIGDTLKTEGAAYVKKVKAIFTFNVTDGPNGAKDSWTIDVKNGNGAVERGNTSKKPDCTITMKDADVYELMMGKLQPQQAFFSGKMKFKGNMSVAMKLQQIMPKIPPANL